MAMMMQSIMMQLTSVFTFISIILLSFLLWIYAQNYRKIKSPFTLGLIAFASIFLLQNVISFYYFATMMPFYAPQVESHVFTLALLQTLAFGVMLYNAWK